MRGILSDFREVGLADALTTLALAGLLVGLVIFF